MPARRPRLVDPGFLAWLREQPCACGCRQGPPCDAAHLRAGSIVYDKPYPGLGRKPDDAWATPLKREHHRAQHDFGDELGWWAAHGVKDPFALCIKYYSAYGGKGGRPIRKGKAGKPRRAEIGLGSSCSVLASSGPEGDGASRLPKAKRKIPSRPFPKQQRKLRSKSR